MPEEVKDDQKTKKNTTKATKVDAETLDTTEEVVVETPAEEAPVITVIEANSEPSTVAPIPAPVVDPVVVVPVVDPVPNPEPPVVAPVVVTPVAAPVVDPAPTTKPNSEPQSGELAELAYSNWISNHPESDPKERAKARKSFCV